MFREYSNDIPACMFSSYSSWIKGEIEDNEEPHSNDAREGSYITRVLEEIEEPDRKCHETLDIELSKTVNKINNWRMEKTGIGPEPRLIPNEAGGTSTGSIYADDQ